MKHKLIKILVVDVNMRDDKKMELETINLETEGKKIEN